MAETVTYTVPAPGGAVTVISDEETTRTAVASLPPKCTDTVPTKLVPRIITFVPPCVAPVVGVTLETVGGSTNLNLAPAVGLLVPPTVDTVTDTVPDPEGAVTVISDGESTRTTVPGFPPKWTETVPTKLWPVTDTFVPPFAGPLAGVTLVTVGIGT